MNGKLKFKQELVILYLMYDLKLKELKQIEEMIEKLKNKNENVLKELGNKLIIDNKLKIKNGDCKL